MNLIQDQYADLVNYVQTHGVGVLAVGDAALQLLKYGAGEGRFTGHLRTDGILRGLGGLYAGAFTTAQRDALAVSARPYGLVILNTTTNRPEFNAGTDVTPNWQPLHSPAGLTNADIAAAAGITFSKLAGFPNDATKFARGDGTWAVVPSTGMGLLLDDAQVLDVGALNNRRAGRVLVPADFTDLGLQAPAVLYNLTDLTDASGNARPLTNKGAVTFGKGITGNTPEAAIFTGSVAQALYRADEAATSIAYGSMGCWMRVAKKGVFQTVLSKYSATQKSYYVATTNSGIVAWYVMGTTELEVYSSSDVCDDRWHFIVGTYDGSALRLYVDSALESTGNLSGPILDGAAPFNIGSYGADGATAAAGPHFGRIDEAFVTPDVLTEDQIRQLMAKKIAHGLSAAPVEFSLMVNRRRRGAPLASADFPSQPLRLHNFTAGALTDEGSGNVALANNGAATTSPGADGQTGDAFNFDGVDDSLSATDAGLPAGVTPRSFGVWFRTTGAAGVRIVMCWGTAVADQSVSLQLNDGILITSDGQVGLSGPNVNDGLWHFAVATWEDAPADGLRRKLYLDGKLIASDTEAFATVLGGLNKFRIGAWLDGTLNYKGSIDAPFVHSVALTPEEIAVLYAKGAQSLGQSPKNAGDHIERVDGTNVYYLFDSIEPQDQIDLRVRS